MVLLFENAVNAELVQHFILEQPGALGDGHADVRGDTVHRVVIGVEDVLPAQHRLVLADTPSRAATSAGGCTRPALYTCPPLRPQAVGARNIEATMRTGKGRDPR